MEPGRFPIPAFSLKLLAMPIEYSIHPEHRLMRTLAWGTLTLEEIIAARQRLLVDPAFDPTFHELMDLSATDAVTFTADEIRKLAAGSILSPGIRRAVVVSSTANY